MDRQYETGFRGHRRTHSKLYVKSGVFEGRTLARIGGRVWDVNDLRAMGYTPLQLALL